MLHFHSMSTSARRLHYTCAQYLALEEHSGVRHEFLDGELCAMAGGSPDHAALAAACIGILRSQLAPGCRAFTSDLRVLIAATAWRLEGVQAVW
jgi:Uma2 family endonuclease